MSLNGYPEKLIDIDDKMLALGRPPPPVVSWLTGKMRGAKPKDHVHGKPDDCPCQWCAACRAWRGRLSAWEAENPQKAIDWYELRESYKAEEEAIEARKWDPDEWGYQLLARMGAPEECIAAARKPQDFAPLRKAREWMLDGTEWSLVLLGGAGVGKTTGAVWAAHQLHMRSFHPRWVRCVDLSMRSFFGIEAELLRHQCKHAPALVLDDIGRGALEKDMRAWLQWLDNVLDFRWGARKKTIITSNKTPGELATWLGPGLADRLNTGSIFNCGVGSHREKPAPREPGED